MQEHAGAAKPARFYGKYRGMVTGNVDPLQLGRVQVTVPDVTGVALNFALPCLPYRDLLDNSAIPPVGAHVWVEFEAGDPSYPIWSGCFLQPGGPR